MKTQVYDKRDVYYKLHFLYCKSEFFRNCKPPIPFPLVNNIYRFLCEMYLSPTT